MGRNFWTCGRMALALSLALACPALAQAPAQERMERPGGGEESVRHFETKKRERLLKALRLDETTQARLRQRLEQLDQKGADLRRQRKDAFESLREQAQGLRKGKGMKRGPREGGGRTSDDAPPAVEPARDSGALKQTLDRVYAVEEAITELRRERVQALRDILTPEQQVKYLFHTTKFQKDMRERLQQEQGGQAGARR